MLRLALLLTTVAIVGCKKPEPAAAAAGGDAGPAGLAAAPAWTGQKVEAFIELERTLLEFYVPPDLEDGGPAPSRHHTEAEVASAEESALKRSGLTPAEVSKMNALLASLYVKRAMQNLVESDGMLQQLREAKAGLPDGSVPDLDAAAAAIVDRQRQQRVLASERAAFGDTLVDLALAREEDLLGSWYRLMKVSSEGEAP